MRAFVWNAVSKKTEATYSAQGTNEAKFNILHAQVNAWHFRAPITDINEHVVHLRKHKCGQL